MYEHGVMMDGRLLIARYRITALTGVLGGRGGVLTAGSQHSPIYSVR